MKSFKEYIELLKESRYKTHGVQHVKRTLPKLLNYLNLKYTLDINKDTDDFQLYFYDNGKFNEKTLDSVISQCEIFGYFPSYFTIDDRNIFNEFKSYVEQKHKIENDKTPIDFIEYLRTFKIDNFNEIYLQFESWEDSDIDYVPDLLYHVCRKINLDKINRYGLFPKSQNKISYHPDRIYLTTDFMEAEEVRNKFKELHDDIIIISIKPDKELMNVLKLKKDPNWPDGLYTSHNISTLYIEKDVDDKIIYK